MARPASAHAKEPGFVRARACLAPCGGEIVLYDMGENAGADRWVVKHQPGGKALRTGSREKAREWYGQLAQGIDKRGVLPKVGATVSGERCDSGEGGDVEKMEKREPEPPKTLKAPPMAPDPGSRGRVREEGGAVLVRTMEAGTVALAAAIDERFPEEEVMQHLEDMLTAEKSYVTDGGVVSVPDWNGREKALRMIFEYKYGKAYNRKEPVASKGVDLAGFVQKLKVPSFRNALKSLIEEAEEEEKTPAAPQTAIVPNKTPS